MVSNERSNDIIRMLDKDLNFKPQKSPQVLVREAIGSDMPFVLTSQVTGEYYNVDFLTVAVWRLIDGGHTLSEIVDVAKKSYSREIQTIYSSKLPDQTIRDIVLFFAQEGLLAGTEPVTAWKRVKFVSAFELDVTITRHSLGFFKRVSSKFEGFVGAIGVGAFLEPIIVAGFFLAPPFCRFCLTG